MCDLNEISPLWGDRFSSRWPSPPPRSRGPQPRPLPAQNRGSLSSPRPGAGESWRAHSIVQPAPSFHWRHNEPRHFQPCREVWGASGPGGREGRDSSEPNHPSAGCRPPHLPTLVFSPAPQTSSRRSLERVSTQPGPQHTHTLTKAHAPERSRAPRSSPAHSARERAYTPRPRGFVRHTWGPRNRLCVPSCDCHYSRSSPTRGASIPGTETPILGGWEGYRARSLG